MTLENARNTELRVINSKFHYSYLFGCLLLLLSGFPINFGQFSAIYAFEIFAGIRLIYAFLSAKKAYFSSHKKFLYFSFLVLFTTFLTGVFKNASIISQIKFAAAIYFFLASYLYVYVLFKDQREKAFGLVFFYFMGQILASFLQPSPLAQVDGWKFGFGLGATSIAVLIVGKFRNLLVVTLSCTVLAFLNLALGFRGLYLVLLVTLAISLLNSKTHTSSQRVFIGLLSTAGFWLAWLAYSFLAQREYLGEVAFYKHRDQFSAEGPLSFLGAVRPEILINFFFIRESPFIGKGPYPSIEPDEFTQLASFLTEGSYDLQFTYLLQLYGDQIPVHSMLFQFWLYAGIIGIMIPFLMIKSATSLAVRNARILFVVYASTLLIWEVLFSPFGLGRRLELALLYGYLIASRNSSVK